MESLLERSLEHPAWDHERLSEILKLNDPRPFRVGHLIAGNRVRKEDAVRIRADFAWKENLPEELERKFSRRAGWLSRLYGYR